MEGVRSRMSRTARSSDYAAHGRAGGRARQGGEDSDQREKALAHRAR